MTRECKGELLYFGPKPVKFWALILWGPEGVFVNKWNWWSSYFWCYSEWPFVNSCIVCKHVSIGGCVKFCFLRHCIFLDKRIPLQLALPSQCDSDLSLFLYFLTFRNLKIYYQLWIKNQMRPWKKQFYHQWKHWFPMNFWDTQTSLLRYQWHLALLRLPE